MNRRIDATVAQSAQPIALTVNGKPVITDTDGTTRLSTLLRDYCELTGTKIGCHAGDCGACTVLMNDQQVCACLVAASQADQAQVISVEGLAELTDAQGKRIGERLQMAFARTGAAQCGICTSGMLMAAADLLLRNATPSQRNVQDALGGVLCRCTGYQSIVQAVLVAAGSDDIQSAPAPVREAVGARIERLDGQPKLDGTALFGSDTYPLNCASLRVVRSPFAHARFELGDLDAFVAQTDGVIGYLTANDIPNNRFAIFPDMRDQPALAESVARFRGEAVLALVGDASALQALDLDALPVTFTELTPLMSIESATAPDAPAVQSDISDNILCRGYVASGDISIGENAARQFSATMQTVHVEHAYIEPEAGYAIWHGENAPHCVELFVTTQTPYLDRDETANMFGIPAESVRITPSVIGGGFGGKLDMTIQPLLVAGARKYKVPVRVTFERPESMLCSTKRHPSELSAQLCATESGELISYDFTGDFNTGPYASWGPTVANRVPIHASGPYRYKAVRAQTRAVLTHDSIGGAFRGFGVPQSTLLNETLLDSLAVETDTDPLQLRLDNAIQAGDSTPCGQRLDASVGLQECLRALQPAWKSTRESVDRFNRQARSGHVDELVDQRKRAPSSATDPHFVALNRKRQGVGTACMWYGIGNTVMANPSEMTVGLRTNGRLMLYNGAVDIGQGTYTIMVQMCADAIGLPVELFDQIYADTSLTADAGKSSASRQTFVSGNAARLAGEQLRERLCSELSVASDARLSISGTQLLAESATGSATLELSDQPTDSRGDILTGTGNFNPPTVPLDENGQGVPYATYGFAAQFAHVEVDLDLGTVRVLHIHAAHDVGKAINPTLVEGQIHGGVAQGLGLALMEHYQSGRTDNLHDYLIPTVGDMPQITTYLIEDPEPLGPYGAKGVGEPALVATAPAILNAIRHACGAQLDSVPVTPDKLQAAIAAAAQ